MKLIQLCILCFLFTNVTTEKAIISLDSESFRAVLIMMQGMQQELQQQSSHLIRLGDILQNCEFCSKGVPAQSPNPCKKHPCFENVTCTVEETTVSGYKCGPCPVSTTGDGKECVDIDECAAQPCSSLTKCTNLIPGYKCTECPNGYEDIGDGQLNHGFLDARQNMQVCKDINECELKPYKCPAKTKCTNTEGSFHCSCPEGFTGPVYGNCSFTGFCNIEGRKPCGAYSECTDHSNELTYTCKCKTGLTGNGRICGMDSDLDGIPDNNLACTGKFCKRDNCRYIPNGDQADFDKDKRGDLCDADADGDGIIDAKDNCPLKPNVDQVDTDKDGHGNECDNCVHLINVLQYDTDDDGVGDLCDSDKDGDGRLNEYDNCDLIRNPFQEDSDNDGIGDVCDNCVNTRNEDQRDVDSDGIGDACDSAVDRDRDSVPDIYDNCIDDINADQLDSDGDGIGDACDDDSDNDGIDDQYDNCPLIFNPLQIDDNQNGRGDICDDDYDGDLVIDSEDDCPANKNMTYLDFRTLVLIPLDPIGISQHDPRWVVKNNGREIQQLLNSDPGIAVAPMKVGPVDYSGTLFVNTDSDDDYVGFVFGYQDSTKFYSVMWKQRNQTYWKKKPSLAVGHAGVSIKVINSKSGLGPKLRNALWHTGHTEDEVKLLWHDKHYRGWKDRTAYRWKLLHRPLSGLIKLSMYEGTRIMFDTGCLYDKTLLGGKVGVFVFSQKSVIWSNLQIKCEDQIPEECRAPE